jgi:hypothetical protein
MNTKTLSNRALSVIDQYQHFKFGNAVCSIPYFNNKTVRARAALRPHIGKGSPEEIHEEVQAVLLKNHIDGASLADESLKKLLADADLGIDCSAFAYYVLNAENEERGKGSLDKHISFVNCTGVVGKLRCALRPIENCDVATLVHDKNSHVVLLKDIQPGDIITLTGGSAGFERDHILVIHQVEYQNFAPFRIHYSHAVAYPEDGLYGSGIKQGEIDILDPERSILEARWTESGKEGLSNFIFLRTQKSTTEIRRLNWF